MIKKHRCDGLGYTAVMEALVLHQKSYQCPGEQQWRGGGVGILIHPLSPC